MLQIYKNIGILVFILCFVNVAVSKKDKDKKKNCTKIFWELQNATLVHNTTGVLKRGDGKEKDVNTTSVHYGLVNVSISEKVCCDGFKENKKGNCKKCKKDRYGVNCSMKCNCEEGQKCDHVDGCIAISTSTTTVNRLTVNTTQATDQSTTSTDLCLICEAAKNCTSDLNCTEFQSSGIGRKEGRSPNKDNNTILVAVVVSLIVLTGALIACIITRERYHKLKKQKKTHEALELKHFDEECHPYVDPEPVYFEIKEDDIAFGNGIVYQKQTSFYSETAKDEGDTTQKNEVDNVECEYLNPYTPLRFARSETNLFRDRKMRENKEYDIIYSIAKSLPKSDNSGEDISQEEDIKRDSVVNSSHNEERASDPVYFVLEKTEPSVESQVPQEREKLLNRSSRSSI